METIFGIAGQEEANPEDWCKTLQSNYEIINKSNIRINGMEYNSDISGEDYVEYPPNQGTKLYARKLLNGKVVYTGDLGDGGY